MSKALLNEIKRCMFDFFASKEPQLDLHYYILNRIRNIKSNVKVRDLTFVANKKQYMIFCQRKAAVNCWQFAVPVIL